MTLLVDAQIDPKPSTYDAEYAQSIADPQSYWLKQASFIDWVKPPTIALDDSRAPFYRWYPDGELNVCYNALDGHIAAGRGAQTAFIYDSAMSGTRREYSYNLLRERVAKFANVLLANGVQKAIAYYSICR